MNDLKSKQLGIEMNVKEIGVENKSKWNSLFYSFI